MARAKFVVRNKRELISLKRRYNELSDHFSIKGDDIILEEEGGITYVRPASIHHSIEEVNVLARANDNPGASLYRITIESAHISLNGNSYVVQLGRGK